MDLLTIYLNIDREISNRNIISWANSLLEISIPTLDDYFSLNRSELLGYLGEYNSSFIRRNPKYEIEIITEEGSIKTWLKISLAINIFIGYGSIRQSIDYAIKDSKEISRIVTDAVISGKNIKREEIINRRTTIEDPKKLLGLFQQVQSGKLSPSKATEKAFEISQINLDEILNNKRAANTKLTKEFLEAQRIANDMKLFHHKTPTITVEKLGKVTDKVIPISPRVKKQKVVKISWNSIDKNPMIKEYYK